MKRLENKVVLVTGAGSGLGAAISHKFAKEGAKVVLCGAPDSPIRHVAQEIKTNGGRALAICADLSNENEVRACVQNTIEKFGKLDILISNSGAAYQSAEIDCYSTDLFDQSVLQNIRSTFLMCKYAVPELQKTAGNIIATGSEAGTVGRANNTPYGGAKGWIHAFIKGLAVEQAKYGIRANCVCPGDIESPENNAATGANTSPMGRRGTPEEVANVFAFLASDMASYVTGAIWTVDGGNIVGKTPSNG